MKNLLLILCLLLVICSAKRESFFGFSGMKSPAGNNMTFKRENKSPMGYSRNDNATIPEDHVAKLIITVQEFNKRNYRFMYCPN